MKINPHSRSSGIALIAVMIAIFVLSVLAGAFAYAMKVETKLAMNASHETDLQWLGRSGVEYARWVLGQQLLITQEPYDSLNQKWAGGPGGLASSNSPLADVQLENVHVGNGTFSLKIKDLERKVNINNADQSLLQQALTLMGVDASEISYVADGILDWIDADDATHINGAESDYYEGLDPAYSAKNAPIDDLSELLLIKGVTQDMYWGAASTNHSSAFFQKVDRFGNLLEGPAYTAGLADIFTPLSSGRININTASATTLQMIPGVDEVIAGNIIKIRSGPDGADGTEDDMPFQNVGELRTAGMGQQGGQALQVLSRYCTVRSSTFEVEIDAQIGGSHKKFFAVLGRANQRDIQILSFFSKDQ
ncbi:MAG: ral secretion pathway protein [Verrucomicrobiota bacterium]|jgi:general secretion pathway protein K